MGKGFVQRVEHETIATDRDNYFGFRGRRIPVLLYQAFDGALCHIGLTSQESNFIQRCTPSQLLSQDPSQRLTIPGHV
jgi:hypothetical protein